MGNSACSSGSDDEINVDYKEEETTSDAEGDTDKDTTPSLDLGHLFDPSLLRNAASKVKDDMPENVLQQHSTQIHRWLEERQQRNEETVTLSQFYDVLMNRSVSREDCVRAFQQFDSEGDGTADIATMLDVLKSSTGTNLTSDLGHVVRSLQACSLTPGFIDVYNEDKESVGQHGNRILNFVLRNRAPSSTLPFPILNGFNNTASMRVSALSNHFHKLKESVACREQEETMVANGEELKPITKCFSSIEVSSNKNDAHRLTNGDFSSYWQSDGSARSHWIRMRMRSSVVIKQLTVGVSAGDQSYMPQVITISVGKNVHSLREIKEIRIPSHVTGDVTLLENAKMYYPLIQVNIKRCHSDGCDTRIHTVKTLGCRVIKEQGVSVMDASATWYLQVLASTANACLPVAPGLRDTILAHSTKALASMGPLALCPASSDKPAFLSQHVLNQMDQFMHDIAVDGVEELSDQGLKVLLSFSVARGSVAGAIKSLLLLQQNPAIRLDCVPLLKGMRNVKDNFWKRQGQAIQMTLAGCDAGQKEETSGPANVLTSNWTTAQPYLSADGQTKVNMFFSSNEFFQITKLRLKVDKGPRGARRGMVFVYKHPGEFALDEHVRLLEGYDKWGPVEYAFCQKVRAEGIGGKADNPVAYFTVEDEWDEVEVPLDVCPVGQYICVKFLEPRQSTAERIGVVGIKFYGFYRKGVFVDDISVEKVVPLKEKLVDEYTISVRVLRFLVALARDQVPPKKSLPSNRPQHLDMSGISIDLLWQLFQGYKDPYCKNLTLQLLHAMFAFLSVNKRENRETTEKFFVELCRIVDSSEYIDKRTGKDVFQTLKKQYEANTEDSGEGSSSGSVVDKDNVKLDDSSKGESKSDSKAEICDIQEIESTNIDQVIEMEDKNTVKPDSNIAEQQKGSENKPVETERNTKVLANCDMEEQSLNEVLELAKEQTDAKVDNTNKSEKNKSNTKEKKIEIRTEKKTDGKPTDWNRLLYLVAKQVIVDGAAVFFPDKEARRKQLFSMMTDVNGSSEALSVTLTFQSLCQFFSCVDPSGLLDLPHHPDKTFDSSPVLAVMETLISVAYREFCNILDKDAVTDQSEHLVHLLCSLQTSLMSWLYKMIDTEDKERTSVVQHVIVSYANLLSTKCIRALENFANVSEDQMEKMMTKVKSSFLGKTLRQFILTLTYLGDKLSGATRITLLSILMPVTKVIKNIGKQLHQLFFKIESEHWKQVEAGVVSLRTWEVESNHNYENNQHSTQLFSCPGASQFIVQFDPRCETERRYDYLEFTDYRGVKTRYDQKVGTEKWPYTATFTGGHKLHFLFHSDSSNNEWGYKFKVVAKGCPDIPLCWMFDLHLSMSKLYGKLCGATLDVSKVLPSLQATGDSQEESEIELLKSELWTTLFRGGYSVTKLQRSLSGRYETETDSCVRQFLFDMVEEDGALPKRFVEQCKENISTNRSLTLTIGGEELSRACRAVFAALLWHTQSLRDEVQRFVKEEGDCRLRDGILHAYHTAQSLRTILLEEKQKQVIAREKAGVQDVTYDPLQTCHEKAIFLLRFAGLTKVHLKPENKGKGDRKSSKLFKLPSITSADRVYRYDIALEKFPSFKLVLDFVRDPAWEKDHVEQLLKERAEHAKTVSEAYLFAAEFLRILTDDTVFQVPNIVFLQELFSYQDRFARHYADGLDGCGLDLEGQVRRSFYTLARRMIDSISSMERLDLAKLLLPSYDYLQACTLHLLDINWQLYDLAFIVDTKLPQLYLNLAKESVSMREKVIDTANEEQELSDYTRSMEWLTECRKEFFKWYESMTKKNDNTRAVQMFVARFCDLLDVEISCDGCGTTLPGRRYRCLQCADMDLCSSCYAGGVKPGGEHSDDHEIIHLMYKCDECQAFIVGTRIHCDVCEDFDLCLGCQNAGKFPVCHSAEHPVIKIPMVKLKLNKTANSSLLSYVHQHVWLSFVNLSLSMANVLYNLPRQGLDIEYVKYATQVHNKCIQLANSCLMHVSLPDETAVDDESQASVRARQDEAFAVHSQERIMGLLGAMIPTDSKTALAEDVSFTFTSEHFLKQLFSIARGETNHDQNTQHFAMGLIGQLLQKATISCEIVDRALAESLQGDGETATDTDTTLDSSTEDIHPSAAQIEGYKTAKFLFNFGATCLERSGLEWANSMAAILQHLFNAPAWKEVLERHLSVCVSSLTEQDQPQLSAIFALFVVAGFPEVLSIGSQVKYTDSGAETKYGVVLKYFPDKNQTLLVDKKSRKRRTLKYELVECISYSGQFLQREHIAHFVAVIKDIATKLRQSNSKESAERIWVLSLALKALLKTLNGGFSEDMRELYSPEFVQCVVYLASQGTQFSRQWLLKDLEILSLTLYTKDKDSSSGSKSPTKEDTSKPSATKETPTASAASNSKPEVTKPSPAPEPETASELLSEDPWNGLDDTAKLCFKTLEDHMKIPVSVLRVMYDMQGQSTNALLMAVHENIDGESFTAPEDIKLLARKFENHSATSTQSADDLLMDKVLDSGMQIMTTLPSMQKHTSPKVDVAVEEPCDDSQNLIGRTDNESQNDNLRARKSKSANLLKKEQETQGKVASRSFLVKVNTAVAILYARQVLGSMLADWPDSGHTITARLLGCQENAHVPFVLDLLNRVETKETFQKVVQNVIRYCASDTLVPIATTSCQFMEEINFTMVTKQSEHKVNKEDSVHIPGATQLSVKFDHSCCSDDSCDTLVIASSSDYKQEKKSFEGGCKWEDFEIPGDTLYMKFSTDNPSSRISDGYKFTVSGGKIGRFDTGYVILNAVLSVQSGISHLNLDDLWTSLVQVACKQTGAHRLKAIQLLLKIMHSQFRESGARTLQLDLTLLKPLWKLYNDKDSSVDVPAGSIVPPVIRALTELFLVAEDLALDWNMKELYVASLHDKTYFQQLMFEGIVNVAAASTIIGVKNKATLSMEVLREKLKQQDKLKAKADVPL